jgi:hypothetical protein
MKILYKPLIAILFLIFSSSWIQAQEIQSNKTNGINFEVSQGKVFYTENSTSSNLTRIDINSDFCEKFPRLCPLVGFSWWRNSFIKDPWQTPPIIVRPWPFPFPSTDPWEVFDICQLELGSSNIAMVTFGLRAPVGDKLGISLVSGVGFSSFNRRTSEIEGANFTATKMSAPVTNIEANISYSFTDRISLNIKAGMFNTHFGDLTVLADDLSSIVIEGFTANSPTASLGIGIRL